MVPDCTGRPGKESQSHTHTYPHVQHTYTHDKQRVRVVLISPIVLFYSIILLEHPGKLPPACHMGVSGAKQSTPARRPPKRIEQPGNPKLNEYDDSK